ncbi:MAG: DUF1549 and DUF1553 domain-containing protein [Gemmataceae bacterium]|nr:DUF1549 and DUF1553 domain-containing protein [Gemmataceae bacterium]
MKASPFVLIALLSLAGPAVAADDEATLPKSGDIAGLAVYPTQIALKGADDARQLIVTAELTGGRQQDLSGDVKYEVKDAKIVRVTGAGRILPLANGTTEITVRFGDKSAKVAVTTGQVDENLPINFGNQVTPIFTKLGCNSGGCHGKASGQNGFKLSLLGFEPEMDFNSLVKEGRGRRLFPAAPDSSLLLLKATGQIPHGGGRRMDMGSDEYKVVRRWIAAGMPSGKSDDPTVAKITVYPERRILTLHARQQFAVLAHYSDGSIEDITRRAQYESNDGDIAGVDYGGVVRTLGLAGEAAIMARYQGHVNVFRAVVPMPGKPPEYQWEPKTSVDRFTQQKWRQLNIAPSELCTDEQFIRRASLDITGTLPTPEQVLAFVSDKDAAKRDKLVDRLVDSAEYSYYFANKWADVLRVKRGNNQPTRAFGTFVFHNWIRESLAADKPYDEFAREILAGVGTEVKHPPIVWYKDHLLPEQFVDDAAQVFLGIRMQCAQCHHHPYEKWSQDDYWGLAAFFGRIGRKNVVVPGQVAQNPNQQRQLIFNRPTGTVTDKKTNRPAAMKLLDGAEVLVSADDDPRHVLVDWLVDAKNPFFARAVANRYWAHFFGRGIVDPLDDMRVTNPPSNPELLDALAKELTDNKYSLKHLVKVICKSRTYQLSAMPNEFNKQDRQANARYYPKRMTAEVLFDAVCQVTKSPTVFPGLPQDKHAPNRAIMLPDESFASYFLDVFGRPQRLSACECERVTEANLAQVLHLLNSEEVQAKLSRAGGRADILTKDARPDREKVEELFLWALGRKPTQKQLDLALAEIERHPKDKKAAYENIVWALINQVEFVFIR